MRATVHLTRDRGSVTGELVHANPNYLVLVLDDGTDKFIASTDVASTDQTPTR